MKMRKYPLGLDLSRYAEEDKRKIRSFPRRHSLLVPHKCEEEKWEVDAFTITAAQSARTLTRAILRDEPRHYVPQGRYARLRMHGAVMMSDTPMERVTNYPLLRQAHGNVLLIGAGLGMLLRAILDDVHTDSVTLVDNKERLLRWVNNGLPQEHRSKITMHHGDAFSPEYMRGRFNSILIDIWPSISISNMPEMHKLREMHRKYLTTRDKFARVMCWGEDVLRGWQRDEPCS